MADTDSHLQTNEPLPSFSEWWEAAAAVVTTYRKVHVVVVWVLAHFSLDWSVMHYLISLGASPKGMGGAHIAQSCVLLKAWQCANAAIHTRREYYCSVIQVKIVEGTERSILLCSHS